MCICAYVNMWHMCICVDRCKGQCRSVGYSKVVVSLWLTATTMYKCNTLCYQPHLLPTCNGVYYYKNWAVTVGVTYITRNLRHRIMHKNQCRVMRVKGKYYKYRGLSKMQMHQLHFISWMPFWQWKVQGIIQYREISITSALTQQPI